MERLTENWLTEGLVDFEYKKYLLLAYLKYVRQNFNDRKLYPFLSDLVFHYRNLQMIKNNKTHLEHQFPKEAMGVDLKKLRITYRKIMEDSELMTEIASIVAFALENIQISLNTGRELYDYVEEHMKIEPVGLSPIYTKEGYFFLWEDGKSEVRIYRYGLQQFDDGGEGYLAIASEYLASSLRSISHTFQQMKLELIRENRSMPNPATYLIVSGLMAPVEETLLPVAKRMLIRYLGAA
jgi:hypothetical protein